MQDPKLSGVETGLMLLVGAFNEYASQDRDQRTLSTLEFKKLVKEQLFHIYRERDAVPLMERLDKNRDNVIDFKEYMALISLLAFGSYKIMCEMGAKR